MNIIALCMLYNFYDAAIQILHVQERQHWVASSYLNGEVQLYDSCSSGSLSPSLQEQLLQLYKLAVKDDQLMVTIQQQRGPEDCGLYSIATAYDAALHKEHHTDTYKARTNATSSGNVLSREQIEFFSSLRQPTSS